MAASASRSDASRADGILRRAKAAVRAFVSLPSELFVVLALDLINSTRGTALSTSLYQARCVPRTLRSYSATLEFCFVRCLVRFFKVA